MPRRKGNLVGPRGTAVRTQQEVADIMYARGLLRSPDKRMVRWYEGQAFAKIRALWPELADEIADEERARTPVVRIY
jgi:hypothetical protein